MTIGRGTTSADSKSAKILKLGSRAFGGPAFRVGTDSHPTTNSADSGVGSADPVCRGKLVAVALPSTVRFPPIPGAHSAQHAARIFCTIDRIKRQCVQALTSRR